MIIRSAANLPDRVRLSFPDGEGRTKQSMRDECDINKIMAKYIKTGAIDHSTRFAGEYGYATSVDFHGAMNIVAQGESMFAELPAALRARFNNDTALFLDFVQDPENESELLSLGLSKPESAPAALPPAPDPEPSAELPEAEPAEPEGP